MTTTETATEATAVAPAKKTVKKPAKNKGATPAKKTAPAKKAVAAPAAKGALTKRETLILQALVKGPKTRPELKEVTGIKGGLSKIMGAPTKDGFGTQGEDSLESRKLVKSEKHEGQPLTYSLTEAGKKALAK